MPSPTIAETVSALLGDDGCQWVTDDGAESWDDVVARHGGRVSRHPRLPDSYRAVFPDGSALTTHDAVTVPCWAVGFADCWCWADAPECGETEERGRHPETCDHT